MYDIKNIIKANIDYTLTSSFYIKNMDNYVMNGEIITLQNKMPSTFSKDYETLMSIALEALEENVKENLGEENE